MRSDSLAPLPWAWCAWPLRGIFPLLVFSSLRWAALNPRVPSPFPLDSRNPRRLVGQSVVKFSAGIKASGYNVGLAPVPIHYFLPLYKCLLEMQIPVFWYFKHLNLFPQACSRRRWVLYLFWDLVFSLNLPLLNVLLCLLAIFSYQAK